MQQEITYASNVSLFMAEIIRRLVNGYAGDQILNDLKDARHHFEKLAMLFEPPAESPNEQPVERKDNEAVAFAEHCKMLPFNFIRGIGWNDPVTGTEWTTERLYNEWKQSKNNL